MKTLMTLTALILATACGQAPAASHPVDVLNGSAQSDDVAARVMSLTQKLGGAVDLTNYTVTIEGSVEETEAACNGGEAGGCSSIPAKTIVASWPSAYNGYDTATLNAISAAALAHEMGHVFYFQTTGDSDHNHTNTEWFNTDDATSVCGRVYDAFNKAVL